MSLPRLNRSARVAVLALTAASTVTLAACGSSSTPKQASAGSGTGVITVWAHDGQPGENAAIQQAVKQFNQANNGVTAKLTLVPQSTYTQTITSTPVSKLPDVFELDGPTMASYVYGGKLSPLSKFVSSKTLDSQISSVQAQDTYQGKRYAVSIIDSGLALYGNKAMLDAAGVKYPTTWQTAWTAAQFKSVLAKLAAHAPGRKALDLEQNILPGEWATYGFLPIVNSTGNVAVSGNTAQGHLNAPAVVSALKQMQSWMPYVDPNTNGKAFTSGQVALSWVGHWMYPAYSKALGSKLVLIPLPNFGAGAKTGQGSWAWGISSSTKNGTAAGKFLQYLTSDPVVAAYTKADGAPPATKSELAADPLYKPGGPLYLYAQALNNSCGSQVPSTSCIAVPRPVTPAYPVITQQFQKVIENLFTGGNVTTLLNNAVDQIDLAYKQNGNYAQS